MYYNVITRQGSPLHENPELVKQLKKAKRDKEAAMRRVVATTRKEADLVRSALAERYTQQEIGDITGLSRQRIGQIANYVY